MSDSFLQGNSEAGKGNEKMSIYVIQSRKSIIWKMEGVNFRVDCEID